MMRLAIQIEYDGSAFQGWQSQPHGATVQDQLERALGVIAGSRVQAHAAGRTDTGVHALAQVAHFDTAAVRPLQAWVRGVNAHLPKQIAVRWAYLLLNHPVRPAIQHGWVGWHHRPLDAEAMDRACAHLLGEHDFSSFRSAECQAPSPVKTLHQAQVSRSGDYLIFEFCAGGFLHHMIRNLIGALLWVGSAKRDADWMADLIALRDRTLAPPTFMPDGLYFTGVDYGPEWQLPNDGRIIAPFHSPLP